MLRQLCAVIDNRVVLTPFDGVVPASFPDSASLKALAGYHELGEGRWGCCSDVEGRLESVVL